MAVAGGTAARRWGRAGGEPTSQLGKPVQEGPLSKPFDATLEGLLEWSPGDWPVLAGQSPAPVTVIDADISTVSGASDKVLRVFRQCVATRGYYDSDHLWSRAFLAHMEKNPTWPLWIPPKK